MKSNFAHVLFVLSPRIVVLAALCHEMSVATSWKPPETSIKYPADCNPCQSKAVIHQWELSFSFFFSSLPAQKNHFSAASFHSRTSISSVSWGTGIWKSVQGQSHLGLNEVIQSVVFFMKVGGRNITWRRISKIFDPCKKNLHHWSAAVLNCWRGRFCRRNALKYRV